jgi:hypothetical protein
MHALWDQLLGRGYDTSDVRRRASEVTENSKLNRNVMAIQMKQNFHDPLEWVQESRKLASQSVYTAPVLVHVQRPEDERDQVLDLPDEYLRNAGTVAQFQAYRAAKRLADVWKQCLSTE